jgi:hypothetical protein
MTLGAALAQLDEIIDQLADERLDHTERLLIDFGADAPLSLP